MTSAAAPAASLPLASLLLGTADAVRAVAEGRPLDDALARVDAAARPGVQALAYHVLRWWGSARVLRARLAPKAPPPPVDALLCTALALLWPAGPPPYAAHTLVDQAVAAARRRVPAAAGFVNAVLRRFLREADALAASVRADPLAAWNHPPWWVERLRADWPGPAAPAAAPGPWQQILLQAQQRPPMTLRVNARRLTGAAWVQRLAASGRGARVLDEPALAGQAVVLDEPCPVQQLPGFADGDVSVQDAAAQRPAALLLGDDGAVPRLPPGARVLDACAAPGGKTAQLLERADLELLALDADAQRLQRVHDTLQRLGLQAQTRVGDAADPRGWWDGRPYDAILVDAPCTASGIVRRHPDVRWLRRPGDVDALARTQDRILDALWPLLADGGRLVYATCSVFRREGQERIDAFLQRCGDGSARLDPSSPGHLLPLAHNVGAPGGAPGAASGTGASHDGFYVALLHKHRP